MASEFEAYILREMPRRPVLLSAADGWTDDPNLSGAPSIFRMAPAGVFYLQGTGERFWRKKDASTWVEMSGGSPSPAQKIITENNQEFWVAQETGNDANDGLTLGTAFQTLTRVLSELPPLRKHNCIVHLKRGVYAESLQATSYYVGDALANMLTFQGEDWDTITPTTGPATGAIASFVGDYHTFIANTSSWTVNDLKKKMLRFTSGAHTGEVWPIASNGTDRIELPGIYGRTWTAPGIGDTFEFVMPAVKITGDPAYWTAGAFGGMGSTEGGDYYVNNIWFDLRETSGYYAGIYVSGGAVVNMSQCIFSMAGFYGTCVNYLTNQGNSSISRCLLDNNVNYGSAFAGNIGNTPGIANCLVIGNGDISSASDAVGLDLGTIGYGFTTGFYAGVFGTIIEDSYRGMNVQTGLLGLDTTTIRNIARGIQFDSPGQHSFYLVDILGVTNPDWAVATLQTSGVNLQMWGVKVDGFPFGFNFKVSSGNAFFLWQHCQITNCTQYGFCDQDTGYFAPGCYNQIYLAGDTTMSGNAHDISIGDGSSYSMADVAAMPGRTLVALTRLNRVQVGM